MLKALELAGFKSFAEPVSVEIYDGMQHLFQANRHVPEAKVSLQRLGQFIRSRASLQQTAAQ